MNASIELHWQTSPLASCFHAADALRRGRPLADAAVSEALAEPLALLQAALREEGVAATTFWAHLLPLSADTGSMQELAERSLVKAIGIKETAPPRLIRIRERLVAIKNACGAAQPCLDEPAAVTTEPLQQQWAQYGAGLLTQIVNRTEPGLLVDEATVVGLYPVQGGGGAAHLAYNLACIEMVSPADDAVLPEVVRLAWLVSMLNLDLPRYSERIRAGRLAMVAALAMLPVAVSAAADVRLTSSEQSLEAVLADWLPEAQHRAGALADWWDAYQRMRPDWGNALKGLDLLLE
jgi:hypothetical protein